ncbi:hypothetical protein G6F41_014358 [Rhizopus arrhizus]|nr:hypothetical protein G6F41_014358 [Rhizopus arrhizus]
MVSSLSPSGPPGSGHGLSPGLPFGPTLDVSSLSSSPTAINSLLYADDVAILGSASEMESHQVCYPQCSRSDVVKIRPSHTL